MNEKIWIYDVETYPNFFCVTFLAYKGDKHHTFVIDNKRNDSKALIKFVDNIRLVGYNNKTFDNIHTNFILKNGGATAKQLYDITQRIISLQRKDTLDFYREFNDYLNSDRYRSLDLMRMLFSKKLRVSLKELECSLQHDNVEELPYPFDTYLDEQQKQKVIEYNLNDCIATKKVLKKSVEQIHIRNWMKEQYGFDATNLDSVNAGVKILEVEYSKRTGVKDLKKRGGTNRDFVKIKDVILPIIEFETEDFNRVLKGYKSHIWYSKDYNLKKNEDQKFLLEPIINNFKFKFSLGGLHGYTQAGIWESNDKFDLLSIDVAGYYPSQMIEWLFFPEHLDANILKDIFIEIGNKRNEEKKKGNKVASDAYKLSRNGVYGNLGNQYSWLSDHKPRLQICVNGQLMLAMLIEKLFLNDIQLIDANTDGLYIYLDKSKRAKFDSIIKWWESVTKMQMEETKFKKIWFLNTADYFGIEDNDKRKEKGLFLSEVALGKGMEFPIIAKAVKEYFINSKDVSEYIKTYDNILDFCAYKKLGKQFTCFHNNEKQQRVNRYYACKSGAYLYAQKWNAKSKKHQTNHILRDSPVILLNKYSNTSTKDRNINYTFYIKKANDIIHSIEGDKQQLKLF